MISNEELKLWRKSLPVGREAQIETVDPGGQDEPNSIIMPYREGTIEYLNPLGVCIDGWLIRWEMVVAVKLVR